MNKESLIAQQEQAESSQMALIDDVAVMQPLRAKGQYSGERLFRDKPEIYHAICAARAENMGVRSICRAFKVHPLTVKAVIEREGAAIDTLKQETIKNLHVVANMTSEFLMEKMAEYDGDIQKVALVMGVSIDKLLVMLGEANQIVAVKRDVADHASLNDWLDSVKPADVVAAQTVSEGEKEKVKGDRAGRSDTTESDIKSSDFTSLPKGEASSDTYIDTDQTVDWTEMGGATGGNLTPQVGGGGGAGDALGVSQHTGQGSENFMAKGGSDDTA